jgi:tetratricopeptide (TPR) repeat protein
MSFVEILLSKKVLISFVLVILVSLTLTFFPLIGTLGFEFSVIIGFIAAFISVFISAECINPKTRKRFIKERRFSDRVSSIFFLNFLLVSFPFVIGLMSSIVKEDCYIKEGMVFYLLIPTVSVFFSSSLGFLLETIFPRRGFFLGALGLIGTICFSIWRLYERPPIFSYNPVFGFFPGPLYDEAIPITITLIVYRITIVFWGLLFLVSLRLIRGFKYRVIRAGDVLIFFTLVLVLFALNLKEEELGISYTRDYITQNFLTSSLETEHFVIYYAPGTPEAKHIELIAEDHEWRYHQLKEFLKVNSNGTVSPKVRSYIYPDIETRKKIIGAGDTTIANPIHREIHLVYDSFPHPVLKHELTHVISSEFGMKILRISPKVGLIEGLAVAADWNENGFTPHEWSKSMIKSGAAPDIKGIIGFGFWYAPPKKSYTLMGSFCRYLIDTYGVEKFKILYRTGEFIKVYGKSLDELVSEWKKFLDGIYIPESAPVLAEYRFSEPSIFGGRCPRRVAALKDKGFKALGEGNFYEAKKFFLKALGFNRGNAALIESLAYTYYYDKDYNQLMDIVEKSNSIPEVDKNILENLRGNALWQSGEVEKAKSVFELLRKKTLPSDLKREIEIKLSSIQIGGEVERRIREYFSTRDKLNQVAILEETIRDFPDYSPSYYLLGRIFFNEGNYKKAVSFLIESESLNLPSESLEKENLRILGISLFATGDYEGAIRRFENIINIDPNGALKDYALDFIERCKWTMSRKLK